MLIKRILLPLIIAVVLISSNSVEGTYIDNGTITILRSQFVDNAGIAVNGQLTESFWNQAGLLSLKIIGGSSSDFDLLFKYINDDKYLYLGFSVINLMYADLSLGIYFDTDNDGVLSTPEDAKSISMTNTSSSFSVDDLYWDGVSWVNDINIGTTFNGASSRDIGSNRVDFEMAIPLISSDLIYDGLQIPTTSNTFIGISFQFVNDFNNGTIETFDFPTLPLNVSGYVDLKLAGPEDKDLPSYVPPVQITTVVTNADTETVTGAGVTVTEESSVQPSSIFVGIIVFVMIIRRKR